MNKKKVAVLMSSYNGEKYIRQQIDSILAQEGVAPILLVRDDGSTDSTLSILREYQDKGLLTYYQGANLGPQRSFMQLLKDAPPADYYAFADQDDVWLPEKLKCAADFLDGSSKEALYLCQTQLVDADLNKIPSVIVSPLATFGEALIYKFAGGCTMVLNNKMRDKANAYSPAYLAMHDIWLYTLAYALGADVCFDRTPHILYRQHGNNTIGQGQSQLYMWKLRFSRLLGKEAMRSRMAKEIYQGYGECMPQPQHDLLRLFVEGKDSFMKRVRIVFNSQLRCPDRTTQLLFWVNVMLNKY